MHRWLVGLGLLLAAVALAWWAPPRRAAEPLGPGATGERPAASPARETPGPGPVPADPRRVRLEERAPEPAAPTAGTREVAGRIEGRVLDPRGAPADGAHVLCMDERTRRVPSFAETDGGGRFAVEALPAGEYVVVGSRAGFSARAAVTVRAGETTRVELGGPGEREVLVHGRVLLAGAALERGHIAFTAKARHTRRATAVGADGRYELALEGPGDHGIQVDVGELDYLRDVAVPAVPAYELDLALPAGVLAGTLLAPDGAPAAGVGLSVFRNGIDLEAGGTMSAEVWTDDGGRFRIDGLAGEYAATFPLRFREGERLTALEAFATSRVPGIRVEDGGPPTDVVLQLELAAAVGGHVVSATGERVAGARVVARGEDGRSLELGETDDEGSYTLRDVPPGRVRLVAATADALSWPPTVVEVRPGGGVVADLQLRPGATLHLAARDAEGRPWDRHLLEVVIDGEPEWPVPARWERDAQDGSAWTLSPLPPGGYRLRAFDLQGELIGTTTFGLAAGESARLDWIVRR